MDDIAKKLSLVTQSYAFETSAFPLAVKPQFLKGVLDEIIEKCVHRPLTPAEQMSLFPFLERESLARLLKAHLEG